MNKVNPITIIGYSGHAYVVCDTFKSQSRQVVAYCDKASLNHNPFNLTYLGSEDNPSVFDQLKNSDWFIAIGSNAIRKKVYAQLVEKGLQAPINAIHKSSVLGSNVEIGHGVLISPNAVINALSKIGTGVICNTGSIIEHECKISNFAHIAPGAVLAGNVTVGEGSFIGANSVVKQGINIGKNVIIGAGTVVIKDIPDNVTIVGNPGKIIKRHD